MGNNRASTLTLPAAGLRPDDGAGSSRSVRLHVVGGVDYMRLVERFVADHTVRRDLNGSTPGTYAARMRSLHGSITLESFTPARLREIADERGWSPATRSTYFATCRTFSAWLYREGLIGVDAFAGVKAPEQPAPDPHPVTRDELERLYEIARDTSWRRLRTGDRLWPYHEWVTLAAYAGLRTFEIARVEREHLRRGVNGWELLVPAGKGGTRASIPAAAEIVKLIEGKPAGPLYPDATAGIIQDAGRRLFDRAGLGGGFHRLRHLYATAIYQATNDPFLTKDLCRHRSLNSTLAYAKVADRRRHDVIGALHS